MADAGQLDFPIEIRVRPLGRDGFGVTDAGAVRAAEPRPLLRSAPESERETESCDEIIACDRVHSCCGQRIQSAARLHYKSTPSRWRDRDKMGQADPVNSFKSARTLW